MVSMLVFAFKITKPIIFFVQSRNYVFHSQGEFPCSRNFSTFKESFHKKKIDQENFP